MVGGLRVSTSRHTQDFDSDLVVVGRDASCDIVLEHAKVSRRHLELRRASHGWLARDLGSTNGTLHDGRRVTELPVAVPLTLWVGGSQGVRLNLEPLVAASPPIPAPSPPPTPVPRSPQPTPPLPRVPGPLPQSPAPQPGQPVLAPPGRLAHGVSLLPEGSSPGTVLTVGRTQANDIVLDDPLVSRRHATVRVETNGAVLTDLGSFNGTFVNERRIAGSVALRPDDVVTFGNQAFVWDGRRLISRVTRTDLTLTAHGLTTVVGGGKKLIEDVSFTLEPSSFTAVIGPSGAGKSTLLGALTGLRPATHGSVVWQGHDLYRNYDQLRYQIGLVPQQDIQHPQLTVRQALGFAARLRLPPDTSAPERDQRVHQVVGQMQLERQFGNRIGTQLSGGQRKRVSIATELLTAPPLLFLDEPTSGLDPGLDRDVMMLLRRLADEGRVVMVVTHSVLALDSCDTVLVLAPGGRIAYFGPPDRVLAHFGCRDYPQVFDLLDEPDLWQRIPPRPSGGPGAAPQPNAPVPPPPRQSWGRQLATLVRRNLAVTVSDRMLLSMLVAMPIVLGLLSKVVPGSAGFSMRATRMGNGLLNASEATQRLTILVIAAALMGAAVTIRELVKERSIFHREYAVGLSPPVYLLSKVLVLGVSCFIQGILVTVIAAWGLPGPDDGGLLGLGTVEVGLAIGALAFSMSLVGLAVSAVATSSEQTMPALVGLVMVQLVLSGSLVALTGRAFLEQAAWFAPARWAYAAAASSVGMNTGPQAVSAADMDTLFEHSLTSWGFGVLMLTVLTAIVWLIADLLVRRSARA